MAQFARPTTDITDGGWTTDTGSTTLAPAIDETSASDADYIQSSVNPSNDTVEIKFGSVTDPASSSGHIVRYRLALDASGATGAVVSLIQGTTEIAAWNEAVLTTTPQTFARTLTAAQADAITNYGDLRLQVVAQDYALRDAFVTAINPLVDGAAEPGPGNRDQTGSLWKVLGGRLRGGMQPSSPTWGNSKIVWDGQTREDGLTLWAIVNAANRDASLGVGWASSAAVTDPTTNGHHWLMHEGYGRLSQPGKEVTLVGLNAGDVGQFRACEYLVGVTLRAQGAFYWISGIAPITTTTSYTSDQVGIPQYPSARVLWVEDTTTTTPMYPHIGALHALSHADGHAIDDLRVKVISDWATDAGMATFLDRFTRADSTTSVGTGWTNVAGTGGISGNKAYVVTPSGTRTFIQRAGAAASGDGIWRFKVIVGSNTAENIECHIRYVNTSNFVLLNFSGGSIFFQDVVAGSATTIANYPFPLSAGQVVDICIVTIGNSYRLFANGNLLIDSIGANGATKTGTGMGFGGWALGANPTVRWDDMMWVPNTITLPAAVQLGTHPSIFTPGATIMDDTFSGSNGAAISGRTPDTTGAGTWATQMGGANGTWTVQSNAARDDSTTGGPMTFAYYDTGSADVEATLTYVMDATGTMASGIVLRFTDTTHWVGARVLGGIGAADQEIEILEANGDTGPIVKFQQIGNFNAASSSHTLKAQLVGDTLHVFLDDVPIISYIVHVASGTRHGLLNTVGADISFDRITMKALTVQRPEFAATFPATGTVTGQSIAVTGAIVTASDGSVGNTFPSISTAILARYRAGAEGLADGTAVGQFTDQSGNARHATQGTAANKPTLRTGILNGKAVYRFDGANDSVSIPSWTPGTGTLTFYVVLNNASSGTTQVITEHSSNFNTPTNAWLINRNTSNQIQGQIHGSGGSYGTFTTTGTIGASFVVLRVLLDMSLATNEATVELNHSTAGTRPTNNDNSGAFATDVTYIGSRAGTTFFWNGDIAEFVILGGDPSSGDKAALDAYFLAEYGV